ncbi:TPA: methyltransferase [Candidatus Delongbacteria bacterium]|nr:MAG: hypothetical protein A2Y39_04915 [Candidatus Delongbacteria bacterium GWF2_40_14]HAQ60917.1 methyltransferase [Candidatus Delongbacteria bacterium]
MIFTDQSLHSIYVQLKMQLSSCRVDETIEFEVIDPDISNEFSGTEISILGQKYIYRPFKVWVDLAEVLHCKIHTPRQLKNNRIQISYSPLNLNKSWHNHSGVHITEKYGVGSDFSKIFKFEEPYFLNDYIRSLKEILVDRGMKLLNLGINRGDEFRIFIEVFREISGAIQFTGIDHCPSAIKKAEKSFPEDNFSFINEDIAKISDLGLPQQDIVISIGTLQSPDIDGKEIFRYIIQNVLSKEGCVILGFPNSRYIDCEVVYGAKTKNYSESNLNLLFKDVSFYKKYLQQHGFKVLTFGKYYVFLVAKKE